MGSNDLLIRNNQFIPPYSRLVQSRFVYHLRCTYKLLDISTNPA